MVSLWMCVSSVRVCGVIVDVCLRAFVQCVCVCACVCAFVCVFNAVDVGALWGLFVCA